MKRLIDQLTEKHSLSKSDWVEVIEGLSPELSAYAAQKAVSVREKIYGKAVYTRGLIEFSNYCKNDCRYCGIRRSNKCADRYRLSEDEILSCCREGYSLGFRTFVLQSGEDCYYTDDRMEEIIRSIKKAYPDCALTLSIGEREEISYRRFFDAGADRYLLRHETADKAHYERLHPAGMSFDHRINCLWTLKSIGYQVGCGLMVGSPGQTSETLAEDMIFIKELQPDMVGIGPFIPHHETPLGKEPAGSLEMTLYLLSLLRLIKPNLLLPATTALGTIDPKGRELGILRGANVVMPNLSPVRVRKKYDLYDNKICTGDEAAECRHCLGRRMESIGYGLVIDRGDPKTEYGTKRNG